MTIKVGINGFGRIGRLIFRNAQFKKNINIVAINDLMDVNYIAYILRYDSIYGKYLDKIDIINNNLLVNNNIVNVTSFENPIDIPWYKFNVDIVIESTGVFLNKDLCYNHILSGAKYVIITKSSKDDIPMYVMGVNHHDYNGQNIVSNTSSTTNCLAPIIKVIHDNYGILEAFMTNIHSYTKSKKIFNSLSTKNWRLNRNILNNIIPSSTSSTISINNIIPDLKNKINGISYRIPISNVSLIDLSIKLNSSATIKDICAVMNEASNSYLRGILGVTNDDVVSSDFNGNKFISIFDSKLTMLLNDKFIKIVSWYDNGSGYCEKVLDLASYIYYYN